MTSPLLHPVQDTSHLGQEVPVGGVERALKKLWDEDQASTKATLVNLVIFSTRAGSLADNTAMVSEITTLHACRVLLIEATPGADNRAWITAHCHLSGGKKSVCSEQIAFRLDGGRAGLVRNTLLAHLLGDLPVICWWQGPLDSAFEPGLFLHVDRLLIDSAGWRTNEVAPQLECLLAARATMARPFSIHDLAWTRTFQFRLAIAALFDHPHALAMLAEINAGEVVVARGGGSSAAMLVAWLATAMRWQAVGGGPGYWEFLPPAGNPVRIDWREQPDSAPIGLVRLSGPAGSVAVDRAAGSPHIRAGIADGSGLAPLVFPADPDAAGALVCTMLSRGGKNSLYSSVLPVFLRMLSASLPDSR